MKSVLASSVHPSDESFDGFNAARMLGVEQEYDLFAGNEQLDFRALFARTLSRRHSVSFRNCDSAAILDAGYMLACDGQEAEFATAPIDYRGEGCLSLAREVIRCRTHMLHLFKGLGIRNVRGYSTHLSISIPEGREREIADAFSTTVAPALILLMEARTSPGMLLRSRHGRLEIGSEYIDNEKQLAAVIVFLAGAVHTYLHNSSMWEQFPRVRLKRWEEANIRPGLYLPRDAYGESIHELGRAAQLELEAGGIATAGQILKWCSDLILQELNGQVSTSATDTLLEAVQHTGSLQIEKETPAGIITQRVTHYPPAIESNTLQMLASARDTLQVTPRFVDWTGAAFSWKKAANSSLIIGLPWTHLPQFFSAAQRGEIPQYSEQLTAAQGTLTSLDQLQSPQLFNNMDPAALGAQALSDKGTNGGLKGGTSKPATQFNVAPPPPDPKVQRIRKLLLWIICVAIILLSCIGTYIFILHKRIPQQPRLIPTRVVATETSISAATSIPQCIPSPQPSYPVDGTLFTAPSTALRWNYGSSLDTGQIFEIYVSTNPEDLLGPNPHTLVGTTTSMTLPINFLSWKFSGMSGKFFWLVRIKGPDGRFVDCEGTPGWIMVKSSRIREPNSPPIDPAIPGKP